MHRCADSTSDLDRVVFENLSWQAQIARIFKRKRSCVWIKIDHVMSLIVHKWERVRDLTPSRICLEFMELIGASLISDRVLFVGKANWAYLRIETIVNHSQKEWFCDSLNVAKIVTE